MSYSSLVNAKLANARYLVNAMAPNASALAQRQLNSALVEAAVMQLAVAYRCFVRELAVTLKLTPPAAYSDARSVRSQLQGKGVSSPEIDELLQLETATSTDADTWLADLLYASAHFTNPQPAAPPVKQAVKLHSIRPQASSVHTGDSASAESLINVVQIDAVGIDTVQIDSVQTNAASENMVACPLLGVEQVADALLKLSALVQRLRDTLSEY